MRLVSDTLKTTTPLITKQLLAWLSTAYVWNKLNDEQREASGVRLVTVSKYGSLIVTVYSSQSPEELATALALPLPYLPCKKCPAWYVYI